MIDDENSEFYEQCFHRLNHMPWLYDIEKHKKFAKERQSKWQEKLMSMETIEIKGEDTYISDENVHIFAVLEQFLSVLKGLDSDNQIYFFVMFIH